MASGPPAMEHLLARVRRWITSFAVGSLWPLSTVRPVAESPPDDPVPVGVDVVDRLQEAEPQGGNVECEQHLPPFPAYYPAPYPVPYPVPYPAYYAYPYAPYPYLYAPPAFPGAAPHPFAAPYALPPAFPHTDPPAAPHPFAAPYAFPPAFPGAAPHPFAAPYAFPPAFPHADPPAAPHPLAASADAAPAVPPAEPHLNRYGEPIDDAVEAILARNRYVEPEEDGEPEIDVVGLDEEVEVPGIGSSRKRTRDDSAREESDAKRRR